MPVKLLKHYDIGGISMKKSISKLLAIIMAILFVLSANVTAFADNEPDWQDIALTQDEFNDILYQNTDNQINMLASGLIATYSIGLSANGTNLLIAGQTICSPSVVKSGFTIVTIKRRASSSASWTTYKTYEDLYRSAPSYVLSKSITVSSGYQYRVYCTHYAKKSIFSTEKITNSSNIITI